MILTKCFEVGVSCRNLYSFVVYLYLVQKETQCFYLQLFGLKIIDIKTCFNSVILPSNKDLDCIVSS